MHLPAAERPQAFFRLWTRKEALLKGRGDGLSFPLELLDVSEIGENALADRRVGPEAAEARRWQLLPLKVPLGYAAALALRRL
jgi:4'-phosphopantetheinyl transferase